MQSLCELHKEVGSRLGLARFPLGYSRALYSDNASQFFLAQAAQLA